jgi:hypothetical protein
MPKLAGTVLAGTPPSPYNGAPVSAWLASRFTAEPAMGTAAPAGSPDAGPVTSGATYGGMGAFAIDVPDDLPYYVLARVPDGAGGLTNVWMPMNAFAGGDFLLLADVTAQHITGPVTFDVPPTTAAIVISGLGATGGGSLGPFRVVGGTSDGPPTDGGPYNQRDLVVSATGRVFVCTTGGPFGTAVWHEVVGGGGGGSGLPAGGATEQVLTKIDGTDGNADWSDPTLTTLMDVAVTSPADLEVLTWHAATSKWINLNAGTVAMTNPMHSAGALIVGGAGVDPTTNLVVGHTATESGHRDGVITNIVLADSGGSYWAGNTGDSAKIDLGAPTRVTAVRLLYLAGLGSVFVIAGSLDDITYTHIADSTYGSDPEDISFPVVNYRYFRFTVGPSAPYGYIRRVRLFDASSPAGTPTPLPYDADGKVLGAVAGLPAWVDPSGGGGGVPGQIIAECDRPALPGGYVHCTSTSYIDVDATAITSAFAAPASGKVWCDLSALCDAGTGVSQGWTVAVVGTGSPTVDADAFMAENGATRRNFSRLSVTGLTPGSSYQLKWQFKVSAPGGYLYSDAANGWANMVVLAR